MSPRHRRRGRRRRAGVALVAALGLMMLAAGLLAGTAVASLGIQRAARTMAATARADAELRRGEALALQGWDASLDSMPVGAAVDRAAAAVIADGAPLTVRTRVRRLGPSLYAATIVVRVGDSIAPVALRRGRLLVRSAADSASAAGAAGVRPLAPWAVTEIP